MCGINHFKLFIILTAILSITYSCDKERNFTGNHTTYNEEALKFKFSIGDKADKYFFGDIDEIKVDSKHNIYVFDEQSGKISIYSGEERIEIIGKSGRGPGEFINIVDFDIANNKLIVLDRSLLRVSLFNTDSFNFIRSFKIKRLENITNINSWPKQIFGLNNKKKVIVLYTIPFSSGTGNIKRYKTLELINYNGKKDISFNIKFPEDEYYVEDYGNGIGIKVMDLPFKRESIVKASSYNTIYYGWTDSLTIFSFSLNGNKEIVIDSNVNNRKISDQDMDRKLASYTIPVKKDFREASTKVKWPAFENFIITEDNKIWIIIYPPDTHNKLLLVFSKKREILSRVKVPTSFFIKDIQDNRVYGVIKDFSTGAEKVGVFMIN